LEKVFDGVAIISKLGMLLLLLVRALSIKRLEKILDGAVSISRLDVRVHGESGVNGL